MNPFYDFFERNVSGISVDITRTIQRQVEELLETFPVLNKQDINLEMECRFKPGSPERVVGPLLANLESKSGLVKRVSNITDLNYSVERYRGKRFTVRDSKIDNERTMYTKMKIFLPRNPVLEQFEDMGLKLSFALEIGSEEIAQVLLKAAGPGNEPLKRVKSRESYLDFSRGFSFDITQVLTSNTGRRETEIEVDATLPIPDFFSREPVGKIKEFICFCEEQGRLLIFRSRTLVSKQVLGRGIARINECLGSASPSSYRIDQRVPQVRNLQVQDLLRENFLGYGATPKADGYRYFMVILENVIMLIQPPSGYKILYEGKDIPRDWVGFVFDGEMIERDNWRPENLNKNFMEGVDTYYCIFDILGFPLSSSFPPEDHQGVIRRINRLKTFFEEVRRQKALGAFRWSNNFNAIYFQPHSSTRIQTPVMKTFVEIKPYEDALATCWHASDAFFESLLPGLRYRDDGLIFTPDNLTYQGLNDQMSLKWKPSELLTIDFLYMDGGLQVRSGREDVPFLGTSLFPLSEIKIENPDSIRLVNGGIYEFGYSPITGRFKVLRPRFDKSVPNAIRTAVQVWTDNHRPVSMNLIRGIGREGLMETHREATWTWLKNVVAKYGGPVCDLSNLRPMEDVPIRFLENEEFQNMFKNIVVYRGDPGERIDFPQIKPIPQDLDQIPDFETVIINGQQCMLLENRNKIIISNSEMFSNNAYVRLLRFIISRCKRVFVRNLPSVVPGKTPATFLPERSAFGNEEELVLQPLEDNAVRIGFVLGGVFHDLPSNSYNSLTSVVAYERKFDPSYTVIPAGHRITEGLEDRGPDLILNGKYFGIMWDYVYNALLPPGYFSPFTQELFQKILPEEDPLESLLSSMTTLNIEEEKEERREEVKEFDFKQAFQTVTENIPMSFELNRESRFSPERGDVFDMISKAMMIMDIQTPPFNRLTYERDIVIKRASELRLILGGVMRDPTELTKAIFERLSLGIVFVRRLRNSNRSDAYFSKFYLPETINSTAQNGFIILEALPETMDMTTQCSLITYQDRVLIHPSDPVLETLFKNPLVEVDLIDRKMKISPAISGKVKIGSSSWPSLHRLFNSLRYIYTGGAEANRDYIREIMKESTDNKADYLIRMEIPKRFHKQAWAIQLLKIMEEYRDRVRPDPTFEERAESEFGKLLESFTDKNRRELLETGDMFLFDPSYPQNLYGKGLMAFRNQLRGIPN
jgi:hypothetical protein